jgi:hypothetical protein
LLLHWAFFRLYYYLMTTNIIVKLQYEALHNWPGVVEMLPNDPWIHMLKDKHRHIFHITLEKAVTHSDRDVEIILFKQKVIKTLEAKFGRPGDLGAFSCEMLAEYLLKHFDCVSAEVLEDNENGAKVYK